MTSSIGKTALAAVFALGAGAASAGVTVNYVNPDKFADLPADRWEREEVLRDMVSHFEELGRQLPAGQDLKVEITDVDLAGRGYPGQGVRELRVAKAPAEWPRISLRYTLSANGRVLGSGSEQLKDMHFQSRRDVRPQDGKLRYEKRMIDDWFRQVILPKASG